MDFEYVCVTKGFWDIVVQVCQVCEKHLLEQVI